MSPSSPVSVGTRPSNRTLEVGCTQVVTVPTVTFKQFPVGDDPFTEIPDRLHAKVNNNYDTSLVPLL